jgi:hypothetical protein
MADNFLENHRAEYEQRKAKWLAKQKKHTPASVLEARKKEKEKEIKIQEKEIRISLNKKPNDVNDKFSILYGHRSLFGPFSHISEDLETQTNLY